MDVVDCFKNINLQAKLVKFNSISSMVCNTRLLPKFSLSGAHFFALGTAHLGANFLRDHL